MEDPIANTAQHRIICVSDWPVIKGLSAINDNYSQRIVDLPDQARWYSTHLPNVEIRILEHSPDDKLRLTAQIRLNNKESSYSLFEKSDIEILLQLGELKSQTEVFPSGMYLRLPNNSSTSLLPFQVRCEPQNILCSETAGNKHAEPSLLYLAVGQMLGSDTEQRRLNTCKESRWLPGPTDGTEVLPLHGHGSGNVMLIRWTSTAAFKPGLDPMGDELLVIEGTLQDSHGRYPKGTWIRNPVETWQSWGANAGTMVYYKNGHFPSLTSEF